jgi:serine phosphatase RsbU (regulator of sigma subunit)
MSVVGSIPDIAKLREQDLEEARIIQDVMLPAHPLREGRVTISHALEPMLEVGGDCLDYFLLSDGKIGLYVGDVSGKGLPAALYAALAVGTLRGIHKTGMPPFQGALGAERTVVVTRNSRTAQGHSIRGV